MIKVTNLKETDNIKPLMLRAYIARKITALMEEYSVDTLDSIGCFILLEKSEYSMFPMMSEMEFVEMLEIGDKMYLHGVRIVSDNYAEDYFLEIERI
ncbi:MAG: hypothetical protein ACI4JB_01190 [Porcipelethomonas sp.]